jgi:hypothetical protein
MKKKLFIHAFLFVNFIAFAQLNVRNNASIFVKNTLVYVKGEINLAEPASTIYLRNEAQLLQGTTGISTNKGNGSLSVFQEGTSNEYRYNYWCSPVGTPSATAGNSLFGISLLNRPTTSTVSSPAIMLSSSYNGQASNLSIATYWIYRYLAGTTYSQWTATGAAPVIEAGQGFTMKGTAGFDNLTAGENSPNRNAPPMGTIPPSYVDNQRYDFRGKPNDGNITVDLAPNSSTLTGNPYPSALDVSAFLLDSGNTNCEATAYYWDQERTPTSHNLVNYVGGYGTFIPSNLGSPGVYTPATYRTYSIDGTLTTTNTGLNGLPYARRFAPVGQGFMVVGKSTTMTAPYTVTIKNSHRVWYKESLPLSDFSKNAKDNKNGTSTNSNLNSNLTTFGLIRIKANIKDLYSREIALVLSDQSTDGLDRGMDGKSPNTENSLSDAYFFLDNTEYVIQSVPFEINKRIKLGVKATENNTTVSFSLKEIQDFDDTQPIYIFDALNGVYHNIKQNAFNAVVSSGVTNNRFELTFQNGVLSTPTATSLNFVVIQNNNSRTLQISNPNLVSLASVQVFDMLGKSVLKKQNLGENTLYELATTGLSDGIYVVSLQGVNNEKFTQKVVVSNSK